MFNRMLYSFAHEGRVIAFMDNDRGTLRVHRVPSDGCLATGGCITTGHDVEVVIRHATLLLQCEIGMEQKAYRPAGFVDGVLAEKLGVKPGLYEKGEWFGPVPEVTHQYAAS